jgi:hypothetical protein
MIRVEVRRVDAGVLLQVDDRWHVVFRSDDDVAVVAAMLVECVVTGEANTVEVEAL